MENLWIHLKKKVGKRSTTNKNELIRFIKEESEKIPTKYDIPKLINTLEGVKLLAQYKFKKFTHKS